MIKTYYKQLRQNPDCFIPIIDNNPLSTLKKQYKDCNICSFFDNKVFGQGPFRPKIMFIGLAPSTHDLETGVPFSDAPGKKIQGIIEYISRVINLSNNVYFTNLILCSGGTDAKVVKACKGRLETEIKLVQPQNIVLLGFGLGPVRSTYIGFAFFMTSPSFSRDTSIKYFPSETIL